MSVYVDEERDYPLSMIKGRARRYGRRWCHLTADSVEELHEFAARIGMRRSWFQGHGTPHYDMVPRRRERALEAGAVFVPAREQARKRLGPAAGVGGADSRVQPGGVARVERR